MAEWPDAAVEELKRLVAEKMSSGQIAKALSREFDRTFTKNAIISACRRHSLQLHNRPTTRKRTEAVAERPKKISPVPSKPAIPAAAPSRTGVSLLQLNEHTCRWPIGDPQYPGFHFCGAKPDKYEPYCAHHAAIAYNPGARRW